MLGKNVLFDAAFSQVGGEADLADFRKAAQVLQMRHMCRVSPYELHPREHTEFEGKEKEANAAWNHQLLKTQVIYHT